MVLSEKRELFEKLLEQIQLEEVEKNHPLISAGEMERVVVHRKSRLWEFTLHFTQILPIMLYRSLLQNLTLAFKDIAQIRLTIKADDQQFDEKLLQDYWAQALESQQCDTPLAQQVLKTQVPILKEKKIVLPVDSNGAINYLKQQYLPLVETLFVSYGFPKFRIEPEIDEEQAERVLKLFEERKQEQAEAFMKQAAESLIVHEQKKKERKEQLPVLDGPIQLGRNIPADEPTIPMINIVEEERRVTLEGYVFDKEVRELRSKRKILTLKITDYTSSFIVKKFSNNEKDEQIFDAISVGSWLKVRGSIQEDTFVRDLVMNAQDIIEVKHAPRKDYAPDDEKRVELHVHSNMSTMDATNSISDLVAQAGKWGHKAIAITDHGGAQAFPEAHSAGKKAGVKILYGVEANVVDDGVPIAYNDEHVSLNEGTYVVFDVETTGLSAVYDTIIELAAVKMYKGNVIESFDEFIDPGHPLSRTTIDLTGITDEMVRGSKSEEEVLRLFLEFSKDSILVAHNAAFDMGFLNTSYAKYGIPEATNPVIDTLELARYLYPQFKRFGLGCVI